MQRSCIILGSESETKNITFFIHRIIRFICQQKWTVLEGDYDHGSYSDQNTLERRLRAWHAIRGKANQRGRAMPPTFRELPKLTLRLNVTKDGIDKHSRVLNNRKPPFRGSNDCALVWFWLIASGARNAHQILRAAWFTPPIDKHECLE